jgi:hypothetical protein
MKKLLIIATLVCFATGITFSQDIPESTGLPGDHFSLQGALDLFQKYDNPEKFEEALNKENNHVNNLDLNEDGKTDYIRVVSHKEDEIRIFILQALVSENESQDIAVIEIEKTKKDQATIQIIGDEEIFGEAVIVEPADISDKSRDNQAEVVVNVIAWPIISYIYTPSYTVWVSPYRWGYYPGWYTPWRIYDFHRWHPLCVKYHTPHVRIVTTHRVVHAHRVYKPFRSTSVTVTKRYAPARQEYKVKRTQTTIKGPTGNKATKTTTTVTGPKGGKVKTSKTKVTKRKG